MGLFAGMLGCRLGLVSGLDRRIVAGINAGFGAGLGGVTHLGALVLHVLHGGTGTDVGRSRGGSIEFGANLCLGRRFGFVSGMGRRINAGLGVGLGGVPHFGALALHVLHGGAGRSEENTSELQSLMR